MFPSIIELCTSRRVFCEQFYNERESIECRSEIVTRSDFNLSVSTNIWTQSTDDIDVIVRIRRRRKICARFTVINETSDPSSIKALTVCARPNGELATTLSIASKTGDGNASIETAESAFIGESSVACTD